MIQVGILLILVILLCVAFGFIASCVSAARETHRETYAEPFLNTEKNKEEEEENVDSPTEIYSAEALLLADFRVEEVEGDEQKEAIHYQNETMIDSVYRLLQDIMNGQVDVRRQLNFLVIGHETSEAEIWVFPQYENKVHVFIEHNKSSLLNFFWYSSGEMILLEDPHSSLTFDNITEFRKAFSQTTFPFLAILNNDAPTIFPKLDGNVDESKNADSNESPTSFSSLDTPITLAAESMKIRLLFQAITTSFREIEPHISILDIQEKHELDRLLHVTYPKLVYSYCQLDKTQQGKQLSAFLQGLQNIKDQLNRTLNNQQERNCREFEKRLTLTKN